MNQSPAHPPIGLGMAGGDTYTSTAMRKHILSYGEQRQAHAQPYPPQAVLPPPAPHQAHQEPLHVSVLSNLDPAQRVSMHLVAWPCSLHSRQLGYGFTGFGIHSRTNR